MERGRIIEPSEVTHLETLIKDLYQNLTSVADDKKFMELLQLIHHPGWTTVAKAMLVGGVVDAMHELDLLTCSDLQKR